jgi:predicted lipoprotein with Yx(FWY)xxD motif
MASKSSVAPRSRRPGASSRARDGRAARHAIITGLATAAAATLFAACGGAATGSAASPGHQVAASHGMVVSTSSLPGIGTVLTDRSGKTVYSPDQESDGKIACTGSCLSFWFPVTVASGTALRGPAGIPGVLGTIHRPDDGLTQLTYNGKPLYTFRLDQAPGQAHGNNYTDRFGSVSFTWHAVTTGKAPAGPGRPGPSSSYSYPNGSSGY